MLEYAKFADLERQQREHCSVLPGLQCIAKRPSHPDSEKWDLPRSSTRRRPTSNPRRIAHCSANRQRFRFRTEIARKLGGLAVAKILDRI